MTNIINVGENEIKIIIEDEKIKLGEFTFNNVREFTYFINMLTDIDEQLLLNDEMRNRG